MTWLETVFGWDLKDMTKTQTGLDMKYNIMRWQDRSSVCGKNDERCQSRASGEGKRHFPPGWSKRIQKVSIQEVTIRCCSNKKLLGALGLTTRSKDATRGSWHRY